MSNQHTANATGMGNHEYSKQTGLLNVESLLSCDQRDFDSDDGDSLKKHIHDNIHNVHNQNKTLED